MDTPARGIPPVKPKLLDLVRAELRKRHYSLRTEEAYTGWIRDYIKYHGIRHPREMGKEEVEGFLSHLAVNKQVAAATQNQALAALLFLYRDVLGVTLEWLDNVVRAKKPVRLPVVPLRVVDLVEEHETQDLPHSGDGLEEVVAVGIVHPGVAGQVQLDLFEVLIVDVDQAEVGFDALFNAVVGEALTKIFPGHQREGGMNRINRLKLTASATFLRRPAA